MENRNTLVFKIEASDGYNLSAKIDYPLNPKSVVIFCQGSGANTYDNHRIINGVEFNYFDLFAREFCKRNIAFCRWNTRGCQPSDIAPDFVEINEEQYQTYCPTTSVQDIISVTKFVKALSQFRKSKIIFMGISEGATIAPLAAAQYKEVVALLLLGFSYENMKNTLEWQLTGGSSMVNMCKWFDYSGKGYVDQKDFELDKYHVRPMVFPNIQFKDLDLDKDGKLTKKDFELSLANYKRSVFRAIENSDDEWLKNNYEVRITSKWCREHFALPPITKVLCSLSMPIFIFHGEADANIPYSEIAKIQDDFENHHKKNLTVQVFENHEHDLNYLEFPLYGIISSGLLTVFNTAQRI